MPRGVILQIASLCAPHDHICLARTNKYLAQSMSMLYIHPDGGLLITVKRSITTAVHLRQALLKLISCHHSSPRIQLCGECHLLRPTDPSFWHTDLLRAEAMRQKSLVKWRRELKLEMFLNRFEAITLAWQDQTPAFQDDPNVCCPACAVEYFSSKWWQHEICERLDDDVRFALKHQALLQDPALREPVPRSFGDCDRCSRYARQPRKPQHHSE